MTRPLQQVVVVGAGAFGTALAAVAHAAGRQATLLTRDAAHAREIAASGENQRRLPGVKLPSALAVTADPEALRAAELVIFAAPAQATRVVASGAAGRIAEGVPVMTAAKGLEQGSSKTQTELLEELLPHCPPAALSGPGFAEEIAAGMPTAVTVAAHDLALAQALAAALATETFRPYASDDLIGVELGGAMKNVLAIAAGIVVGQGLGDSARAALISRGLAEMIRLGAALGARPETFMGLSGLGDLVLTATSLHSRNLRFGMALAEGRKASDLLAPGQPLVEGAHTADMAVALARRHDLEMPITSAVAAVAADRLAVDAAIALLLSRPLTTESL